MGLLHVAPGFLHANALTLVPMHILQVHELVQTLVPPQFGNYTVMHKTAVAPRISDEVTADFEPKPQEAAQQVRNLARFF